MPPAHPPFYQKHVLRHHAEANIEDDENAQRESRIWLLSIFTFYQRVPTALRFHLRPLLVHCVASTETGSPLSSPIARSNLQAKA